MKIKIDRAEYTKRHDALIKLIARDIRFRLAKMGLGEDQELVESLVFDICVILDGGREAKVGGGPLRPFLMFADDEDGKQLVMVEGASWMHEVCGRIVEKMYAEKPLIGVPDPPSEEEVERRLDLEFYDRLGPEDLTRPCKHAGCSRGAIRNGFLCKRHHFEMIKHRECPFEH